VPSPGLWPKQHIAIGNLEKPLRLGKPRALIQMATGSGKTFTAANISYRLIKHAHARRVCFQVDRTNPSIQTLKEFQQLCSSVFICGDNSSRPRTKLAKSERRV
jgi:type I restriction enzyme R subunit